MIDIGMMGGQHLFFEATDCQDTPAQGNFTGHGEISAHRTTCQGGNKRGGDSDACRWAIFGQGVFRHMDMQIGVILEARVEVELVGARANIGEGGISRLAHDFTQLAGNQQFAFARHGRHLNG